MYSIELFKSVIILINEILKGEDMFKYIIEESGHLSGEIDISGSKNAALPIIAASLLADGDVVLKNIPCLSDTTLMCDILKCFGAKVTAEKNTLYINSSNLKNYIAPYDLSSKIRGSFLVMGPMLARCGKVRISLPGGCPIGTRPVDLHLKAFAQMGAEILTGHGYIDVSAKKLTGAKIHLDFPSVGATENIMMAAIGANGTTYIGNASQEPEIVDLANFLNKSGAKICGAGTDEIKIVGRTPLSPCEYSVIPDRIEAGTFMVAAAITGGKVTLNNVIPSHLSPVIAKLTELGVKISAKNTTINITANYPLHCADIKTMPHPGFPTDMQALMMSLLSVCDGTSVICETIFENRFMHAPELVRMGASIKTDGRCAIINGRPYLTGACVKATDLRAGAALSIAALCAKGKSEISDIYHIERGYELFDEKLIKLGAKILKVKR